MEEKKVGEVIKFFAKINVAIRLSEGSLKVGDTIHIVGILPMSLKQWNRCRLRIRMFRRRLRCRYWDQSEGEGEGERHRT